MKRKTITDRMKLESLFWSATIICAGCGKAIFACDAVEWDHFTPLALGGEHEPYNIRPLHKSCHSRKTFGNKSTTLSSDIHTIAKTKRLEKRRLGTAKAKPKRAWPKRKFAGKQTPNDHR